MQMTDKGDSEMSTSNMEQGVDLELEVENEGGLENVEQDVTMESESEDEGIQTTKKRSKRMIIDDDDEEDGDKPIDANSEDGNNAAQEDCEKEGCDDSSPGQKTKTKGSPVSERKRPVQKKLTVDEVLTAVLRDSDSDEQDDQLGNSGVSQEDSDAEVENGEVSQGPVKFDGDLFDAEDSSDDDNDLDRAAGPEYDSAEDKDFDESAIDPKLLKKLKKMKGASKKPREKKSRKCKPTKDDMLALHSESQRLMRETHVSLPYHRPAPKSLQDFLARAQKKQAYKDLRKGTRDIELARIIEENIAESSIEKLPRLRHREHSSCRNGKHSSVTASQQSLPDSGVVSSGVETHSQNVQLCEPSVNPSDHSSSAAACPLGDDELPDIVTNHSDGLCDSQDTLKGSENVAQSQDLKNSPRTKTKDNSQNVSDGDDVTVEEFGSPRIEEDSQRIEDVETLSVKERDSQRSEGVTDSVPESLDLDNICDEAENETGGAIMERDKKSECSVRTDAETFKSEGKQSCEDVSGIKNDFSKQLPASSPVKAVTHLVRDSAVTSGDCVTEQASDKDKTSLKAARQKALEELTQKGVVPEIGKGGGDFIDLDEGSKDKPKKEKKSNIDKLVERVMRNFPKRQPKRSQKVEIRIVEKVGEDGQKKELKLKTVTYCTDGEPELDLSSIAHMSGNRLQALKEKLEVGMKKQREAAYARRQQLYQMENEEGYEGKAGDGLPAEEEEAEMTDRSDTEDEEEKKAYKKLWNNPILDVETDEDDDDELDDGPLQRAVCAEINDIREEDIDLFQDSDQLCLRLDSSDEEEEDENQENKEEGKDGVDNNDDLAAVKKSQNHSQTFSICGSDDGSQLQSAQDPTKFCDPEVAGLYRSGHYPGGNLTKNGLDLSFEVLTPMTCLLQGTQPGSSYRSTYSQPEDSQDLLYCSSESNPNTLQTSFSDDAMSQILDADGYFRVPTSQPRRTPRPSLMMDGSQDAADQNMDILMGLCSGQFAEGSQEEEIPSSGGFEGMFDNNSQSQDDRGSLAGLFDTSSQNAVRRDSQSEGDSASLLEMISRRRTRSEVENKGDQGSLAGLFDTSSQNTIHRANHSDGDSASLSDMISRQRTHSEVENKDDRGSLSSLFDTSSQNAIHRDSHTEGDSASLLEMISRRRTSSEIENMDEAVDTSKPQSQSELIDKKSQPQFDAFSQSQKKNRLDGEENMDESLGFCSGGFPSSDVVSQKKSQTEGKKKGVKRRLIVTDDSSDEEGDDGGTVPFLVLSDDEATKDSDKNELSGSDEEKEEDQTSDTEQQASFRGFKEKRKLLRQFVEAEAELSGSEAESDENLDLDEEDDFLEMEAGDNDELDEEQLRDEVGRVHMKQLLDDDDRQLMRYKEMYLQDGDLYSEGGGRMRHFLWKDLGYEESQPDLFDDGPAEEKETTEAPEEKVWRMERIEREKFVESQQEEVQDDEDNSQFMKFGQFFMRRQVSEPAELPKQPMLRPVRRQSLVDKASPGKFLKPKVPKRGSFLCRTKENLAKVAEVTKTSGLNVNGTRGSRFVFSVKSSEEGEGGAGGEQLLAKAATKTAATPAAQKATSHKPPAKKKRVESPAKPRPQKSIFRLMDK